MKKFHPDNTLPQNNEVFVFGSNLAGRHGAGAAKVAKEKFGAVFNCGDGFQGNSYAIPTKDIDIVTLPLHIIKSYVDDFLKFAKDHPEMNFFITRIGCGLAGYKDEDIAPLFINTPFNCDLPITWKDYI
jgi:hypothetical protein